MLKLIYLISFIIIFSSCNKEKPTTANQLKEKTDSIQKSQTDTIKKPADTNIVQKSPPKDTIKEITFKEFANEYIKNVKSSKKYFLDNSEGSILKDGYEFVQGYLKSSKVKSYNKTSVRLIYPDGPIDYEADLKFRKNKNGNWKAYMIDTFGE